MKTIVLIIMAITILGCRTTRPNPNINNKTKCEGSKCEATLFEFGK